MPATDIQMPPPASPAEPPALAYEQCESCASPVERTQRYCVFCGAHRRHVHDPADRYLASATRATRSPAASRTGPRRRGGAGLGAALLIATIPLAVGLGVLVGRASNSGDGKLLAALRAQRPEVITTAGAGGASSAATYASASGSSSALTSTFPQQTGYAVELQTVSRSEAASVSQIERAAKAKGAKDVGLILPSDFRITPAPPTGTAVVYSGAYKTRSAAQTALSGLRKQFRGAIVIHVQSVAASTAGAGRVLSHSVYGTAHQVTGYKATPAGLSAGAQAVNRIQRQAGKSYVNSQRGLPDVIPVP